MKKTITLIAICITGNFHWVFAQMNFAADDGLHFSKPNCLIFGNQGNGGTELLYQPGPNESTIKWQTIKETNTSHFEVEMSFDGINFTSLKKVAASDYTQWPTNYYAGFHKIYLSATKVYYRIKTVFSDSAFSYGSPSVFSVATGNHQVSYASLH